MTTGRTAILSPILNVMTAAAEKAARGMVRDFGELEHLQVSKKGLGDFVSTADKAPKWSARSIARSKVTNLVGEK